MLDLTLACWDYDRTRPLIDGRVKPEGIDLDITILRPRVAFQRMLDKQEFQVSVSRQFDAIAARIEGLAGETEAERRSAFEELSRNVLDLGERIRAATLGIK